MGHFMTRRTFLKRGAGAGAGLGALAAGAFGAENSPPFKTRLRRAVIVENPGDEPALAKIREAGFDGIECRSLDVEPAKAEAARKVADRIGLPIHSVLFGSAAFNSPGQLDAAVESVAKALKTARIYGADALLLVAGRIGRMPMPEPWEFDVAFDEKNTHVTRVAAGDNAKYRDYIEAHNQATAAARGAIERLIPTAEKTGVVIAVENVWNNLWVTPGLMKSLVASFQSPWARAYFDIGNHIKYGLPPEQWIRALGSLIVKCHVKDFQLDPGGHGGKFVAIRDGSVDWPSVRKELDNIGYNGWLTIEGSGGLSLLEQRERLDLILAGK